VGGGEGGDAGGGRWLKVAVASAEGILYEYLVEGNRVTMEGQWSMN